MKICCISDTHGFKLSEMYLPEADILLHAGDATNRGTLLEMELFNAECEKILHKYKYGIYTCMGNHDCLAETDRYLCEQILTNCNLLIDESVNIEGINIYGSPWQPEFFNWAFNLPRHGEELQSMWERIPENTDILLTHGPARYILDYAFNGSNIGCELLLDRIRQLKNIKAHIFGHCHYSYGYEYYYNKLFINASACNELYQPLNKPILVNINTVTKQCEIENV